MEDKKKIFIENDFLKGGGVENVLEILIACLLEQGNEVTLMIQYAAEEEIRQKYGNSVKIQTPLRQPKRLRKYGIRWFADRSFYVLQKQLFKLKIMREKYDIAIAFKEGPVMKEVSVLNAGKKFAWIHTDYSLMHWTKYDFKSAEHERRCMEKYDSVVCVSKAALDGVAAAVGNPGNLCVRYNPVDYRKIRLLAQEPCDRKRETEGMLFVSVGRLAYPKNYMLLLEVCCELSKRYDFELWIIGDGAQREEMEKKIRECSLKCVKLLGKRENPFPYVRQADVFVSSSLAESYGLAVQEALILGTPAVAVGCPAIAETLDERFGRICEGNFDSLRAAMEYMLTDKDSVREYRENIKRYYCAEDLYEKRLEDICSLWRDGYGRREN